MSSPLCMDDAPSVSLDRMVSLLGVPPYAGEALSKRRGIVVRLLVKEAESILKRLAGSATASQFRELRDSGLFSNYVYVLRSVSDFVHGVADQRTQLQLAEESLATFARQLNDRGLDHLGRDATYEALFSLSTFRKINRLLPRLYSSPPADQREQDCDLSKRFGYHTIWAQMHLDCLRVCIENEVRLAPGVRDEILDGMRKVVMAYAFLRKGLALREPEQPPLYARTEWDDEDRDLVAESEADLALTPPPE